MPLPPEQGAVSHQQQHAETGTSSLLVFCLNMKFFHFSQGGYLRLAALSPGSRGCSVSLSTSVRAPSALCFP